MSEIDELRARLDRVEAMLVASNLAFAEGGERRSPAGGGDVAALILGAVERGASKGAARWTATNAESLSERIGHIEAEALAARQAFAMLVAMLRVGGFDGKALVAFMLDVASDPEKLARIGDLTADAGALRQSAKMALELVLDVEAGLVLAKNAPTTKQ